MRSWQFYLKVDLREFFYYLVYKARGIFKVFITEQFKVNLSVALQDTTNWPLFAHLTLEKKNCTPDYRPEVYFTKTTKSSLFYQKV